MKATGGASVAQLDKCSLAYQVPRQGNLADREARVAIHIQEPEVSGMLGAPAPCQGCRARVC